MVSCFTALHCATVPGLWTCLWILLVSWCLCCRSVTGQQNGTMLREDHDLSKCGVPRMAIENRISQGEFAKERNWPWHGGLFYRNDYQCGCTLINELFVLTASHCVYNSDTGYKVSERMLSVKLGMHSLSPGNASEHIRLHTVLAIISHAKFATGNHKHDVALLRLNGSVQYSDYIQPVCLDLTESIWVEHLADVLGTVVGWGITEKDRISDRLLTAEIPIVRYTDCVESNPDLYGRLIYSGMYCAGLLNGTSPCNGDSGGGMYIKRGQRWFLRGVVSFSGVREGTNYCDAFSYVVFMNVPYYTKWISTEVDAARESLIQASKATTTKPKANLAERRDTEDENEDIDEYIEFRQRMDGADPPQGALRQRTVLCGQNVTLSCRSDPKSVFVNSKTIRWYRVDKGRKVHLTANPSLNFHDVRRHHAGEYWCQGTGKAGQLYESGTTLVVSDTPIRFQQDGKDKKYAVFNASEATAGRSSSQFSFEITFKSNQSDALLFHKPPLGGMESWNYSLWLDRSRLAFRMIPPGQSEKVFRSAPLNLLPDRWYTALVSSYGGQGFLALDGQYVLGFEGHLLQHRLDRYYIADAPELQTAGFSGCVSRLMLNEQEVQLERDFSERVGVELCDDCASTACTDRPEGVGSCPVNHHQNSCINYACSDGRCDRMDSASPETACDFPLDKYAHGLRFQHNSYASYRSFLFVALTVQLEFRLHSLQDGIVFHTAEHRRGYGKFVTILLKAGRIELRFMTDAHLHTIYLESVVQVTQGQWHRLQAGYADGYVYLQVDSEQEVGRSVYGAVLPTNQQLVVFVGGVRWKGFINRHRDVRQGLDGCIRMLKLSGLPVDLVDDMVESANISSC